MIRILLLIVGVGSIVALGLVIGNQSRLPVERPKEITRPSWVYALGRIEGASEQTPLRFELAGRVADLQVEEGQIVEADTVLARQDDREYRHRVAVAEAELRVAQAELERVLNGARQQERAEARHLYEAKLAELEGLRLRWNRTNGLVQSAAISRQEADDVRTQVAAAEGQLRAAEARLDLIEAPPRQDEVDLAKARVARAEAQLDLARFHLERTRLKAPCDGQVLDIDVEVGEISGPDAPTAVVTFADTSRFRVRAYVEELDALKLAIGMPVRVTADALGDTVYTGRITRMSPQMGRKQLWSYQAAERYDTRTREIWVALDPDQGPMLIGLPVDVIADPSEEPEPRPAGAAEESPADPSSLAPDDIRPSPPADRSPESRSPAPPGPPPTVPPSDVTMRPRMQQPWSARRVPLSYPAETVPQGYFAAPR